MTDVPPPTRISDKEIDVNITGYALPAYHNDQPVLIALQGTSDLFVPVFSTIEKLQAFMSELAVKIHYDKIKQVMNGREFADSVLLHARIAIDPYVTDAGRLRWTEIVSHGAKA